MLEIDFASQSSFDIFFPYRREQGRRRGGEGNVNLVQHRFNVHSVQSNNSMIEYSLIVTRNGSLFV